MLISHNKILASGAVVSARMYYYILDALDTNPTKAEFLRELYKFERINELDAKTFQRLFRSIVELELD